MVGKGCLGLSVWRGGWQSIVACRYITRPDPFPAAVFVYLCVCVFVYLCICVFVYLCIRVFVYLCICVERMAINCQKPLHHKTRPLLCCYFLTAPMLLTVTAVVSVSVATKQSTPKKLDYVISTSPIMWKKRWRF